MNFCSNCGSQLTGNSNFCPNCGVKLPVEENGIFSVPSVSSGQNVKQAPSRDSLQSDPPTPRNLTRSFAESTLFLFSLIAFTLGTLFNSIWMFNIHNTIDQSIVFFSSFFEEAAVNTMEIMLLACETFIVLPPIIATIGLWLIFFSANNKSHLTLHTAGFTVIQISVFLRLVFFLFFVLILLIASFPILFTSDNNIVIFLFLISAIIIVFVFKFYTDVVVLLNTVKQTLVTDKPCDNISTYVAVICYLSGFLGLLSILLPSVFTDGTNEIIGSLLIWICNIFSSMGFGNLIFQYRNRMQHLILLNSYVGMPTNR